MTRTDIIHAEQIVPIVSGSKIHPRGRKCPACSTILSIYNAGPELSLIHI